MNCFIMLALCRVRRAAVIAGTLIAISGLMQAQEKAPHRHRKAVFRTLRSDGTADAYNWAGYAIAAATPPATATSPTGVKVTSISGSWTVPKATCTGRSTQYAAFWIGIDGWYSNSVEQIGTDSDCSSGEPQYYAWYEFYPEDSYYACSTTGAGRGFGRQQAPACPLKNLSPGDVITASVTYNPNGTLTATISAATSTGAAIGNFSTTYTPNRQTGTPQLSSAEWIAEAPCCTNQNGVLPLSDFGALTFTNAEATVTTTGAAENGGIGNFYSDSPATWWQTTMVLQSYTVPDNGVNPPAPPSADIMASAGPLLDNGTGFQVTWVQDGP